MDICLFSKHFQSMDAAALGQAVRGLGIEGVDLTVRAGGHVEPAKVATDLPAFQKALAKNGVRVTMLTTSITGAEEPHAASVIETAGRLGIRYVKLGYWHYEGLGSYERQVERVRAALKGLEPLLKQSGVKAGLHTHSGPYMGANAEFALRLVEDCNPQAIGIYYDAGHCTVEGGGAGWLMGLDAASDRLLMVAVKDMAYFRLDSPRSARKGWRELMVPLDSGLVDWPEFVRCLKKLDFQGPVSFHSEYQGRHSFVDMSQEEVVAQTKRDLEYFKALVAG
jgi:sugar phosphate isomerase/epimerase